MIGTFKLVRLHILTHLRKHRLDHLAEHPAELPEYNAPFYVGLHLGRRDLCQLRIPLSPQAAAFALVLGLPDLFRIILRYGTFLRLVVAVTLHIFAHGGPLGIIYLTDSF